MSHRYPLSALVAASGLSECALGRKVGLSGSTLKAAREKGLTEPAADRYAARAGLVAYDVWPEMLDHSIESSSRPCVECGGLFVPCRRSHRFCSKGCYQRRWKREKYRRLYATDPGFRAAETERSRRYKAEARRAVLAKKRAYYRANRHLWVEARRRRREDAA